MRLRRRDLPAISDLRRSLLFEIAVRVVLVALIPAMIPIDAVRPAAAQAQPERPAAGRLAPPAGAAAPAAVGETLYVNATPARRARA